jgi:anti-sigma B factor antagonist
LRVSGIGQRADEGESMSANPGFLRSDPFSVEIEENADTTIVHCTGPLLAEHTEQFKNAVKPQLVNTKRLLIDMSGVTYVDSAGLGAIVSLYTSARAAHCEFKLVHFNEQIRDLLRITSLLWMLE